MVEEHPHEVHALRRTSALALGLELLAVVGFFIAFSVVTGEPATACGWCDTNAFDVAVRRALYQSDPSGAARWSHVCSLVLAPALSLGALGVWAWRSKRPWWFLRDASVVVSAFLLTTGITDGVKKLADRQRPGFLFGRASSLEAAGVPAERFLSFFSGDTAWAWVLVSVVCTLAVLRGYRGARTFALVGGALAAVTGALRVAADMHWATDALAGAAVGVAVGVGLPALLHRRVSPE